MKSPNEKYRDKERRKELRVKSPVVVYTVDENAQIKKKAVLRDISISGIGLSTPDKLSKDTVLPLNIYLEGSSNIVDLKGKVLWCQESDLENYYDVGLEIVSIDDANQKKLYQFILQFEKGES